MTMHPAHPLSFSLGTAALAALVAVAAVPAPQDSRKAPKAAPAETALAGAASPVHERLARLAGRWRTASTFEMGPGQKSTSAGEATIESVIGGRFLLEKNSGTEMGEPIQGVRFYGYNAEAKRYEASWCYSRSTAKLDLVGQSEDGGKTIRLAGGFATGKDSRMELVVVLELAGEDR